MRCVHRIPPRPMESSRSRPTCPRSASVQMLVEHIPKSTNASWRHCGGTCNCAGANLQRSPSRGSRLHVLHCPNPIERACEGRSPERPGPRPWGSLPTGDLLGHAAGCLTKEDRGRSLPPVKRAIRIHDGVEQQLVAAGKELLALRSEKVARFRGRPTPHSSMENKGDEPAFFQSVEMSAGRALPRMRERPWRGLGAVRGATASSSTIFPRVPSPTRIGDRSSRQRIPPTDYGTFNPS